MATIVSVMSGNASAGVTSLPPSAHSDYTLDVLSLSAWAGWLDGSLFDDDDDVIIVS